MRILTYPTVFVMEKGSAVREFYKVLAACTEMIVKVLHYKICAESLVMDKSFNDQELSDIMKEIEALEQDFADSPGVSSESPVADEFDAEPTSEESSTGHTLQN
jgi:hypothetical protein